ncbi:L,D-transpeptidase [Actinomycetota bacterium Odt1-20B]
MARSSSGFVAGLTAAALAVVGFLAYQASASAPDSLTGKHREKSPSASSSRSPKDKADPKALPGQSGSGERVVYALGDRRVWLVDKSNKVERTFEVTAGSVDPAPGTYTVSSRSGSVTGTDGKAIEHVVRFTNNDGVAIGFSAAVDGSTPKPDPSKKTGGIRESRKDGNAMWEFALMGTKVVVVP